MPGTSSFHALSIGVMVRGLRNLKTVLDKAEAHVKSTHADMGSLMTAQLYPDMYNLLQQLQYACYVPADFAQHFADRPLPRVGYDEISLGDCRASIDTTIAYLESIRPERMAGAEDRLIPPFVAPDKRMTALDCAVTLTVPDFFFHTTVAYAILRHKGVPLGKADFLGNLPIA
jgi:uncharacterized protein